MSREPLKALSLRGGKAGWDEGGFPRMLLKKTKAQTKSSAAPGSADAMDSSADGQIGTGSRTQLSMVNSTGSNRPFTTAWLTHKRR
jgi:hypothetical protein